MKKRTAIVAGLVLFLAYSCRKTMMPVEQVVSSQFSVQSAKEHIMGLVRLEGQLQGKVASLEGADRRKSIRSGQSTFYPFWNRALAGNYKEIVDFVEVPIALSNQRIPLYRFPKDDVAEKPDASVVKAAFQRLIVFRDKKGNINQRLITYIPDKKYVKEHSGELSSNSIKGMKRDFSGYLEYKTWEGNVVAIVRIESGKVARTYKVSNNSNTLTSNLNTKVKLAKTMGIGSPGSKTMATTELCELVCTEIYEMVCVHDDNYPPDVYAPKCYEEYKGDDCQVVCQTIEDPDPNENPCPWGDCGSDPCGCGVGGSGGDDSGNEDPNGCNKKPAVNAQAADQSLKDMNASISSHTDGKEWGVSQNLNSMSMGSGYKTFSPYTENSVGQLNLPFNWDSTNGYTIGTSHSHPGGTAPSLDDIFSLLKNLNSTTLTSAGQTAIDFYKENASLTVLTANASYIVNVNDWAFLADRKATYLANKVHLDEVFNNFRGSLETSMGYSEQQASEALISFFFGKSINIFKAPANSSTYQPIQFKQDGFSLIVIECP